MALKDWKKFENKSYRISWQKGLKHIIIFKTNKNWGVSISIFASDDKYFKTKPQALKFAKNYMRNN